MNVFANTFLFQVDAKHFNYQWKEAMNIEVEYSGFVADGVAKVAISKVSAAPWLLSSIMIHSNWLNVYSEMESAAKHNALEVSRNDHVDQAVLNSIRHFIRP